MRVMLQVHEVLSEMAAEFEEAVRLSGGWVDLALPSAEDAARYFASFRRAPPDNSALVPGPQVIHQYIFIYDIFSVLHGSKPSVIVLALSSSSFKLISMSSSQVAITDEEIVRAMVEEVEQVMSRPLFCAALKVCHLPALSAAHMQSMS